MRPRLSDGLSTTPAVRNACACGTSPDGAGAEPRAHAGRPPPLPRTSATGSWAAEGLFPLGRVAGAGAVEEFADAAQGRRVEGVGCIGTRAEPEGHPTEAGDADVFESLEQGETDLGREGVRGGEHFAVGAVGRKQVEEHGAGDLGRGQNLGIMLGDFPCGSLGDRGRCGGPRRFAE